MVEGALGVLLVPEPEPKPVPEPVCAKVAIVEAARKAAAAAATLNVCTFMVLSKSGVAPASRGNASSANAVPLGVVSPVSEDWTS